MKTPRMTPRIWLIPEEREGWARESPPAAGEPVRVPPPALRGSALVLLPLLISRVQMFPTWQQRFQTTHVTSLSPELVRDMHILFS